MFLNKSSAALDFRPGLVLAAVAVVQFLVSLDLSVVNVALPSIADDLGFSDAGVTWVVDAYALTYGGLLLMGGKAADRFGRKRVLLSGLGVFGLACMAGGLAQHPGGLVAARAVQGIGAAALSPAALALLTATFPTGKPRVRAFGVWSAVNAAGGAFGVLIGGAFTEYAGWRWVMFVNVTMAIVALALAWRALSAERASTRRGRMDVPGAVLGTGGMTLVVFGVVRTTSHPWGSAVTLTTLAVALILLVTFIYVEHNVARDPLVRLGILAKRSVAAANGYNLLLGAAMGASFYLMSLYLQRVLGASPATAGIEFLPFALGVIAGSVLAIKLGYRVSLRSLLIGGGLLTAGGFVWFGMIDATGSFAADILGPSIVTSTGFGLCLGPVVSTATRDVAAHEAGTASGLLTSSRQIGAALGLAALGTVAAHRSGDATTPQALTDGYALGMTLGAGLLLAAVLIAVLALPRNPEATAGQARTPSTAGVESSSAAAEPVHQPTPTPIGEERR